MYTGVVHERARQAARQQRAVRHPAARSERVHARGGIWWANAASSIATRRVRHRMRGHPIEGVGCVGARGGFGVVGARAHQERPTTRGSALDARSSRGSSMRACGRGIVDERARELALHNARFGTDGRNGVPSCAGVARETFERSTRVSCTGRDAEPPCARGTRDRWAVRRDGRVRAAFGAAVSLAHLLGLRS